MNIKSRWLALALVCLLVTATLIPVQVTAKQSKISMAEFREKYTAYVAWLDSNASSNSNLETKVRSMSDEEFQALYESFADPDAYIALTEKLMARPATPPMNASTLLVPGSSPSTVTLYSPDYPHGDWYDAWIYPLTGLGILYDADADGSLWNDRCSTDGAARLATVLAADQAAAAVADTLCNSFPDGVKIPFCVAAGVLHEVEIGSSTLVEQCGSQDGSVDSAELEAAYENTIIISNQVSALEEQIEILETNQEELLEVITSNQIQLLRIEIERELSSASDSKRVSDFYLPADQGGLLELVRQVVSDTIANSKAAGLSVSNAQSWFAKAESSLAKGNYKTAYDLYKKSYQEAVK